MNKILFTILTFFLPLTAFASYATPWIATTTTNPVIFPTSINGVFPPIKVPYITATSTTATSTFAGGLLVDANKFVVNSFNGNVGVGTAAPTAKFHIFDTTAGGTAFRVDQESGSRVMLINSGGMSFNTTGTFGSNSWGNIAMVENYNGTAARAGYLFKGLPSQSGDAFVYKDNNNVNLTRIFASGGAYFAGNVGIGTTSPAKILDIYGAYPIAQITATNGTDYAGFKTVNNGGAFTIVRESSVGGQVTTGSTAYAALISANGTYPMQFAVNNAIGMTMLNGGNVGIGTTSPLSKLSIQGSDNTSASSALNVTGLDGESHLFVRDDGNIGVGTNNPLVKLQINQDTNNYASLGLRVYGASTYQNNFIGLGVAQNGETQIISNGSNGVSFFDGSGSRQFKVTYNSPATDDITFASARSYTGRFVFSLPGTDNNAFVVQGQGSTVDSFVGINQLNPRTYLDVLATSGSQMRLTYTDNSVYTDFTTNSSGNLVISPTGGNIGIGTTSPFTKLSVAGSAYIGGNLTATGTLNVSGATALANTLNVSGATTLAGTLNVTGKTTLGYASTTQIGSTGSAYFATSGGNVGIGTSTPGAKLDIFNSINGATSLLNLENTNTGVGAETILSIKSNTAANMLAAIGPNTLAGTEYSHYTNKFAISSGLGSDGLDLVALNTTAASSTISFFTGGERNSNERMRITNIGNVGIATTSPFAKLSVAGNAYIGGSLSATGTVSILTSGVGQPFEIKTSTGAARAYFTSGTGESYSMSLADNASVATVKLNSLGNSWLTGGNLGIGTTTPNNKLNIYGGGITINPGAASAPTCSVATRGTHWIVFGGAGVADIVQYCLKDASDNYSWVTK